MARARNIKPGFFAHEFLGTAEPLVPLIFAGLWCLADHRGRLLDRPRRIKAEIFPHRDALDVVPLLDQLEQAQLIRRYQIGSVPMIQVRTFDEHQNPHWRERKQKALPPPPGERDATGGLYYNGQDPGTYRCEAFADHGPFHTPARQAPAEPEPDSGLPEPDLGQALGTPLAEPPATDTDDTPARVASTGVSGANVDPTGSAGVPGARPGPASGLPGARLGPDPGLTRRIPDSGSLIPDSGSLILDPSMNRQYTQGAATPSASDPLVISEADNPETIKTRFAGAIHDIGDPKGAKGTPTDEPPVINASSATDTLAEDPAVEQASIEQVWSAFAQAYEDRYQAPPVRNTRINGQLRQLVRRLPCGEAPQVARFYVQTDQQFYIQRGHAFGFLLNDCEKLHTQWVTGQSVTAAEARQIDSTAGQLNQWERAAVALRADGVLDG